MSEKHLPLPFPVVKKSNALARASWSVKSVYEPRLVALVASRVRLDDVDFQDYEIPIQELLGTADTGGKSYKLISDVVDNLLGRIVTLPKTHGWIKCAVFSRVEYDGKSGVIRARFDPSLKDHYLNLKSQFTQYSLFEFLLLPSTYSQRLFEVLKSWSSLPETTVSLADLYLMLDVPASHRSDFAAFRRRVLEKAHKDINSKTSLSYEWEPIKKGRSVDSIRFTFGSRSVALKEKADAVKQEKESKKKNVLFRKSVDCWSHYVDLQKSCNPDGSDQCTLCQRLNWPKDSPLRFGAPVASSVQEKPPVAFSAQEKPPVASSAQEKPPVASGKDLYLVLYNIFIVSGLSRCEAQNLSDDVRKAGRAQDVIDSFISIKERHRKTPKNKRPKLPSFIIRTIRKEFLND